MPHGACAPGPRAAVDPGAKVGDDSQGKRHFKGVSRGLPGKEGRPLLQAEATAWKGHVTGTVLRELESVPRGGRAHEAGRQEP